MGEYKWRGPRSEGTFYTQFSTNPPPEMSLIDSMPTMPAITMGPAITADAAAAMGPAITEPSSAVDPAVPASVREAAQAAMELKEVGEREQDLDKQIEAQVAAIHRAVGALWAGIERGPSPGEELGAPEETLGDAEALEAKLYELQKERNELKSQEYKLIRQLRAARVAMRQVPFGDLKEVVQSEKSVEEEYEAAKAEMRRREMLCLAIRHILGGKYWMPHKGRAYCVYDWFASGAEDVRNETVRYIASFAFSEEDAKTIGKAVCGLLGRPDRDGSDVALTELCGLSAKHGPWFVSREDYQKLMVTNKENVDAIIGTKLKAKLHSVDPVHWDFCADSVDSADSADREGREGREAKSARLTEPTGTSAQ